VARPLGIYRYQLRALTSLARYLPVYIGLMLSTAFTLSVLYDSSDTGAAAYRAGGDLLGLYGGFGAIVLPFILLATARLRRGRPQPITAVDVQPGAIRLRVSGRRRERTISIANRGVKSAYAFATESGRMRVSLELEGGPTDGDRVDLDLARSDAEPIALRFAAKAPHLDLSRSGFGAGLAVWAVSLQLGFAAAWLLMQQIETRIAGYPHGAPAGVEASDWLIGLTVTAVGLFGAIGNLMLSPTTVVVGVDGLRVESFARKRFIPFSALSTVRRRWFGIEIVTHTERLRRIAPGVDRARIDYLLALCEQRRDEVAQHRAVLPELAPGPLGDAVKRWREAILGRVDVASYRAASMSRDDLAGTLTSPAVPPEGRIAAALALTAQGESDARENIRLAATQLADERTRAILEDLADEEADAALIDVRLARYAK